MFTGFLASLLAAPALAGEINTGYFGDVAIKGYDPVAYFTLSKAIKGSDEHKHRWLGATWHFSSSEHLKRFQATPTNYAPQYGGYCADGIAYGQATANIDPEAWRIIDGKLYLNYDPGAAQELEELEGQLQKAEANWPEIKKRVTAK
ncbi:MAG: hypothetical protein GTO67_03950 [Gammaproteobacteria bacterium]|nr:hypothetical protein [Gammaproteobacteria bacterium]NIM71782.1 hypothetical protein [Gammaproteobacteria bacterium]NIN37878.1 hypothetical protein [Gammaproteobacteria bacterium]NIO23538.1 hypothetical protein [Gammaproteobacteria bacterium]NIO64154.1 hypothetical protein [Gammaproteobacteria bacterium]